YTAESGQLLRLLESKNPIGIAAALALRRLAAPATADAILKWVQNGTEQTREELSKSEEAAGAQIAKISVTLQQLDHLIETLGILHHQPAIPLLEKYLPLPPPVDKRKPAYNAIWQDNLREAAIWSLGHIFAAAAHADGVATLQKVLK